MSSGAVEEVKKGQAGREPVTNLGAMLRCFMAMERWSMRKLAPSIGISPATLHRVCAGYAMDADTLLKIINWMARPRV